MLAEKATIEQAKEILKAAPRRFTHFPALADLEELIREFGTIKVYRGPEPDWISKRCPGIPAAIEALCLGIELGKTEDGGWQFGFRVVGIPVNDLWAIYEDWSEGKLHPLVANYNGIDRAALTRMKQEIAARNARHYQRTYPQTYVAASQEKLL